MASLFIDSTTAAMEEVQEDLRLWRRYEYDLVTDIGELRENLKEVRARIKRARAEIAAYKQAIAEVSAEIEAQP